MKESMKAYLASRGVEEVSKLAHIVGTFCVIYFMIRFNPPPPQLELSRGTSEAEIAKKDYFSAVAKDIIEKAIYGTLDAAHRYVVRIHTSVCFFFLWCYFGGAHIYKIKS